MTLREFIEQERRDCHVFDIEEFFDRLQFLKREDGEEIEPEEFAKLNLNENINTNQDNTTDLFNALWQQGKR